MVALEGSIIHHIYIYISMYILYTTYTMLYIIYDLPYTTYYILYGMCIYIYTCTVYLLGQIPTWTLYERSILRSTATWISKICKLLPLLAIPKGPSTHIQSTFPKSLLRFLVQKPYILHILVLWTLRVCLEDLGCKFTLTYSSRQNQRVSRPTLHDLSHCNL